MDRPDTPGANVFSGASEMHDRVNAFDWSSTSLGPVECWPQSLRTAVSICLTSGFPMLVMWGQELVQIYNDGFCDVLSKKHPRALGQPAQACWPELWEMIGPMYRSVLETGEAIYAQDVLFTPERNGYVEEAYFTFSYSPVQDESQRPGGILAVVSETTERVLTVRRVQTLQELAARAGEAKSAHDACRVAAETLAANPADVPFALLYLLDDAGERAHLVGTAGLDGQVPESLTEIALEAADGSWPFARVLERGQPEVVTDFSLPLRSDAPWPEPPSTALVLALQQPAREQAAGFLVAGVNARRVLDDGYRGFYDLVARQIASAVNDARAYEEAEARAEELSALDRAKTAFFQNVSHEFRTPLTLILSPLEQLLGPDDQALPPASRRELEVIYRNTLRLLKLVNTLLDFSRIEAGRAEAVYEPTDLSALTADLASTFRSAMERAGLRYVVDCPPLSEPVYVDRDMWEKIVLNLISNALKFTFEGEICVRIRRHGAFVRLEVSDTGVGIAAEHLPHLFDRFHRVPSARSRTHEGTGIGLALVDELVRLHGGEVRVESVPGAGSTFAVAIPLGINHLPGDRVGAPRHLPRTTTGAAAYVEEAIRWLPAETQAAVSEASSQGDGRAAPTPPPATFAARILLADDNADMREYLKRTLAPFWRIEAVRDGEALLEAVREQVPDLIIADVMMPGLDGFALLRRLREDERTRLTPVILLSARAGEEARIEGLEAGASDYVVKPFSSRELIARIGAQLEHARRREEESIREREQQLRALNRILEKRVEERTQELEVSNRLLQQQNRALQDFAHMASHDLKEPLRKILTFSEMLAQSEAGQVSEAGRMYMERMQDAASRMMRLITDLLTFSRITSSGQSFVPVDLSQVASDVLSDLEIRIQESGGEVAVGPLPTVEGDETQLRQLLQNLIDNALKFRREGVPPHVRVSAETEEIASSRARPVVHLRVEDNGIGFEERFVEQIFAPFQRLHGRASYEGTGIGLAICRRIVERHGGEITARSVLGEGSTFEITLPVTHALEEATAGAAASNA